jgi:hypothetical protein
LISSSSGALGGGSDWNPEAISMVPAAPQRDRVEVGGIADPDQVRPARAAVPRGSRADAVHGEPAGTNQRVQRIHLVRRCQWLSFAVPSDRQGGAVSTGTDLEDGGILDRGRRSLLVQVGDHHRVRRSGTGDRVPRLRQALIHHAGGPHPIGGGRMLIVRQPFQPIPVGPIRVADRAGDQQLVRRVQHGQLADHRAQ